jgi:hypothetical protein
MALSCFLHSEEIYKLMMFEYKPLLRQDSRNATKMVFHCCQNVFHFLTFIFQERGYCERWTTRFWEFFHHHPLLHGDCKAKLLDIMLFADETVTSVWNGTNCHPIVMTLGNLPIKKQGMHDGKLVIGYIPKLTGLIHLLYLLQLHCILCRKYVGSTF